MNQYPKEIVFMHGNMQHRAILIHNTQEPLNNNESSSNNNNNDNNNDFSNCFFCGELAMSQPFYTIDNTRLIIHASCVVKSARTIAGERNRSILPSHPPLNFHQQPPQYINYDHLARPPPPPPPPPPPHNNYVNGIFNAPYPPPPPPLPHNNYANGIFNAPYPPPYFNLHQQPPQCINYSYLAPPPHYVNCSNALYPPPYPYYVAYPPPPPQPQNIHNNHHHGYGGMLGLLGTSVVGNLVEAFFESMFNN
ncbi:hypothetical protein IHE45_09G081100 [Dioscorea alata]|uniref:Uncharacterized protein n=1 Tax=Dioscorea alata TaxID=55571 RepID=A0ACB7VGB2_DIOAL|nr:hypothetical protein IHE45_09G081100 [Dioscorea alata]